MGVELAGGDGMALIYSFVARGTVVLADHSGYSGNFSTVAIQCLQKCPETKAGDPQSKLAFTADRHTFCYLLDSGFVYMVVADASLGRTIPFSFLEKVRSEFQAKFAEKAKEAIAHSLDKAFGPKLKQFMEYCVAHPEEFNKVAAVQRKVEEVKTVMVDNIEKVLERGEKIELLVDKTENMRTQANKFQKVGRQLRDKMWWANMRMKLFFILIVLAVIVVGGFMICFSMLFGGNCMKQPNPLQQVVPQ